MEKENDKKKTQGVKEYERFPYYNGSRWSK